MTIKEVESDTSRVYEIINEELGELALMIRPTFVMKDEDVTILPTEGEKIGPEQLIIDSLKGYGNSEVTELAIDLYRLLSKDKLEESKEIIDQYFDGHYTNVVEDTEFKTEEVVKEQPPEKKEDVQQTFDNEVQE